MSEPPTDRRTDRPNKQVFDTRGKKGEVVMIAGVSVSSGKLSRSHLFRVVRDGEVVQEGLRASSMRRFKDRVNEVGKGKVRQCFWSGVARLVPGIGRQRLAFASFVATV